MIGVFDSGFGGLGVLSHLRRVLPRRDFCYLGDSGRAPYGGRDVDTILDFSEQAVEHLFDLGCRVVVVACNTVSCVALRHLQLRYCGPGSDRRILGVAIPGAELAVATTRGRVGVLATARTVASGTYTVEIHKLDPGIQVFEAAAPLLAPLVEEGWEATEIAQHAVRRYLERLPPVDALVLGCTHYPLLRPSFDAVVPSGIHILDPAPATAEKLAAWLERHPGFDAEAPGGVGALSVSCTGDPVAFAASGARFLGEELPAVTHVAESKGRLSRADPESAPRGQVVRPS
jgi:glutamate racemase